LDTTHLEQGFLRSLARCPDRPAIEAAGTTWTYAQLHERARRLARALASATPDDPPRAALLTARGPDAYAAVLAILYRGNAVVPLNPTDPPGLLAAFLDRARVGAVLVDATSAPLLLEAVTGLSRPLVVIPIDGAPLEVPPPHRVHPVGDQPIDEPIPSSNGVAEVLFTSGSTGRPKAVPVRHESLRAFVEGAVRRWRFGPEDRFSQTFDFTFDLHDFDLFVAWEVGACVVAPPPGGTLLPIRWIRDAGLTVWFSVPSVGVLAHRTGALAPGRLGTLRWVGFCGEPLPCDLAEAWAAAAPNARVENLYGPTELTVACTSFRWRPGACVGGLVPIGDPLPGVRVAVVNASGREVPDGAVGELVATGPQRAEGYWEDPDASAAAFVELPGRPGTWYRTGDRVRRSEPGGPLCFVGRNDDQVQVRGHRVELCAVESAARSAPGVTEAVVVPWPRVGARVEGLAAFVVGSTRLDVVRCHAASVLPRSHLPHTWRALEQLPLTPRGKVDRAALVATLAGEQQP
jgi:amino acid adenylation domain-containing protein